MGVAEAPLAMNGEYPVQLSVTRERQMNQLWGVPLIGILVRAILAIPHILILMIMSIGLAVWFILGWIPILILGRQPGFVVSFLSEFIHRSNRIYGYVGFLLPGGYPPLGPGSPSPVNTRIDVAGRRLSRLWGIPIIGFYARLFVLIPHMIVLAILSIVVYLSEFILWIPILVMGRYPNAFVSLYARYLGYSSRVQAYALLLPVPYPPFSFSLSSPAPDEPAWGTPAAFAPAPSRQTWPATPPAAPTAPAAPPATAPATSWPPAAAAPAAPPAAAPVAPAASWPPAAPAAPAASWPPAAPAASWPPAAVAPAAPWPPAAPAAPAASWPPAAPQVPPHASPAMTVAPAPDTASESPEDASPDAAPDSPPDSPSDTAPDPSPDAAPDETRRAD